jgi:hypothetical protein
MVVEMKIEDIVAMLSTSYDPEDLLDLCADVFPPPPDEDGYSDQAEWIYSAANGSVESGYRLFSGLGAEWIVGHLGQNRATGKWDCNLLHPGHRAEGFIIGGAAQNQPDMAAALLIATLDALRSSRPE